MTVWEAFMIGIENSSVKISQVGKVGLPPLLLNYLTPFPRFLKFSNLSLNQLAFDGTHLVEKDDTIAMISFVEHAARGQFCSINFKLVAVDIMRTHNSAQTALDRRKNSWKREAAFLTILIALDIQHFRIDHHDSLIGVLATGTVHHKQAF